MNGGGSERITHQFIVQPQDTNFIYQYAVVFQDPGHLPSQQPFFDFVITAQNGDTVPCSFQHYVAGAGITGFQTVSTTLTACATGTSGGQVKYKPWSTVGVNLGKYLGQQVSIICTVGDCSQCGHFGYSYLDFSCGTTTASQFCVGSTSVTVTAPLEPGATYSWVPGGQTTSSITANPQTTDTVAVFVTPPAGCGYYVKYILEPTVINPAFTYTTVCNTANFTNATTITGGTITTYSWSFPGGSPSSSNLQTPPTITYPPGGTYTATLTVVSLAGCTVASVPQVFTLQPAPVTNAGSDVTVCGANTIALNGSGSPGGGTFSWTPSTYLSNSAIANPIAGPFSSSITYTLTYTNLVDGCKGTDAVSVTIGAEPVADASYSLTLTCEGVNFSFKDSSQNANAWHWDFGDGSTSDLQHPPAHLFNWNGTYAVTFIASNGACRDTDITVLPVGDINAFIKVKAPNVFTPNGDNLNDCFKPIITGPAVAELEKCMTLEVYDRWGIKIFESTGGADVCWDGKTKSNTKAKDGTYYYLMEMGGTSFKGYITLLREKK
jgi:gliding motility-associated-like protein